MKKNNAISNGSATASSFDFQSLTQQHIEELMQQGIMPEQIAELAIEQGQPIPPIIQQLLSTNGAQTSYGGINQNIPPQGVDGIEQPGMQVPSKTSKFPAIMDLPEYAQYSTISKQEQQNKKKLKFGAHKQNVYGYMFSDLINEKMLRDIKRTQGSFLVGVNLSNLFNEFKNITTQIDSHNNNNNKTKTKKKLDTKAKLYMDSNTIFKKLGEYVNVDFDKILDNKMGFRGSDISLLPELTLSDNSTFYEVINESKKYATNGYGSNITPFGLLIMTRMLYKYKKNNAQWIRVATILELIYKYFGNNQTREDFFKNKDDISILSLMELEEFYNTDHLFMLEEDLYAFKNDLTFYKYNSNIDIKKQLRKLLSKTPPII